MTSNIRQPAVAGRFYPGDPHVLRNEVRTYLSAAQKPGPKIHALACIAPHAGYMYSGPVAGAVFARVEVPPLCLILCPNHTGMGRPLSIMSEGAWQTPLGAVPIESKLATNLKNAFPILQEDALAHRSEHAIEVELPFLKVIQPDLSFVPVALGTNKFDVLELFGNVIADVVAARGQPVLIIASSDMNHYESDAVTRVKDESAINAIRELDARALYEVVTQKHVSMCGYGPAIAVMTAAKKLGAQRAELVKYATSGDVSGDHEMVVGYAGIIIPAA